MDQNNLGQIKVYDCNLSFLPSFPGYWIWILAQQDEPIITGEEGASNTPLGFVHELD